MTEHSKVIEIKQVVIRFSGDSGDGMQMTGSMFSDLSAIAGKTISTFPDFPADIRAPQGTVGGVSGFQVHVGESKVHTPGDLADVLVAMNPAALKANKKFLKPGATIIIDSDSITDKNLEKAGYLTNDPIVEDNLQDFNIIHAPITTLTRSSLKDFDFDHKSVLKTRNMFALGIVIWLFNLPVDEAILRIKKKFAKKPQFAEANALVIIDGVNYGSIIQAITPSYHIPASNLAKGKYRNINGNHAAAWGLIAGAERAGLQLFLGSYPITPATEILQELSNRKDLGVKVFQAEDEIAGICTAIGASFGGLLGTTSTSGPGLALKAEAIGLAVMAELPLVIVNVQRGGPSTGLPTKTEQADLMQALYGRNGESPCVVIAASTPSNCFEYAFMACKIAVENMCPVILLTDGFLANGSQAWRIPNLDEYPTITPPFADINDTNWTPYKRQAESLVRYWAKPGTPGFMHRVGGLEKDCDSGCVSHDPMNHQKMVDLREQKVKNIANTLPELEILGNPDAELLVVGWGGTFGHLYAAVEDLNLQGIKVAMVHFNYINPLPLNTGEIFDKFKKIIVCELNLGQLANYLRMNFQGKIFLQHNKVQGLPFSIEELKDHFKSLI